MADAALLDEIPSTSSRSDAPAAPPAPDAPSDRAGALRPPRCTRARARAGDQPRPLPDPRPPRLSRSRRRPRAAHPERSPPRPWPSPGWRPLGAGPPPRGFRGADRRARRLRRRRRLLHRGAGQGAAVAAGRAGWYLPSRSDDGYGLSATTVERLARRGTDLLITVDCGITAVDEVAAARAAGIDVVVTDHHSPRRDGQLPDCAIIHPAIGGYPSPTCAGPRSLTSSPRHSVRQLRKRTLSWWLWPLSPI